MIRNYFKIAFRNLWRNRQFTLINVGGLALGMAVFFFIVQFVAFEWSANRFNKNFNQLYRVNVQHKDGNVDYYIPPGFAPLIKQQVPSVEDYVRIAESNGNILGYDAKSISGRKLFRETNIAYVDGSFLEVFSFPLIAGTPSLTQPKTLALSEQVSLKLFGTTNAIGKIITVSNQFGNTLYTVTAVYRLPKESDLKADVLLSLNTLESAANRNGNDWADPNGVSSGFVNIYLLLKKDTKASVVADNIIRYVRSVNPESKEDNVVLQPFSQLHLAPSFNYPFQTFGNLLLVVVFACVAVLILLIAWVNYINLSTAQALKRVKEVGVKKVLGAGRMQLALQYLVETFILTFLSAIIAIFLVNVFQNTFNEFTGKQLSMSVLNYGWFWLLCISLIVLGSLLSGGYVAFVLTSFKPIATIGGKVQATIKGFSLRKGLVVFQFTVSIILIIATVILYKQLRYMQTEKLGMQLNQLLVLEGPTISAGNQGERNVSFKNAVAQLPFVKKYAGSSNVPGKGYSFSANGITQLNNPQKGDELKPYSMFICDDKFFDTYGITLLQGSTFSREDAEQSWNKIRKVIINEKAAQSLGFNIKEDIIGRKIMWGQPFEIIGVVKDYHHLALRDPITPAIYLGSTSYSYFTVQTDTKNMEARIRIIKNIYNSTFPGNPFSYFFADENFDKQYVEEKKLGTVFIASACVAILIACMGLFGLVAYSATQRIKEIGIRKVLGATVTDITTLLSKDFIRLVVIAIVIASPVAWWAMSKWLQNFAYRTDISWWLFVITGLATIVIALATVSFQAIKAALANPGNTLRSE